MPKSLTICEWCPYVVACAVWLVSSSKEWRGWGLHVQGSFAAEVFGSWRHANNSWTSWSHTQCSHCSICSGCSFYAACTQSDASHSAPQKDIFGRKMRWQQCKRRNNNFGKQKYVDTPVRHSQSEQGKSWRTTRRFESTMRQACSHGSKSVLMFARRASPNISLQIATLGIQSCRNHVKSQVVRSDMQP